MTPGTAARQASLPITNSQSPPKPTSIESLMPFNHLILCHPLPLLPSIFPSIRIFSNESALHIRCPKYWSFNISPSNEHPRLICFRMDCLDLLSWTVLWRPIRPSRTNTPKRCPFHYRGLECKSRKSRNTWSNRQIWPWSTEWSRAKATRVLPRKHTDHSKHPLPTTQEKILHMDITRWSTPKSDWLYS